MAARKKVKVAIYYNEPPADEEEIQVEDVKEEDLEFETYFDIDQRAPLEEYREPTPPRHQ